MKIKVKFVQSDEKAADEKKICMVTFRLLHKVFNAIFRYTENQIIVMMTLKRESSTQSQNRFPPKIH